ncbi:hypothetical protein GCM10009840_08000 [Pseudolysinimonas kribbensis]|uniref:DUF2964 family protein n=1 Tax=Pseudolysinimonas kribbensis TaxID=433641 RepID=A0ABQ6K3H7_9MICO|nr:hypothetical protein [Pseudolysinimonas kribbensis]GMA95188.1 hypothetical protein GCM10025881_20120 [Pseudolysinimonas kribbensis]
MNAKPSLGTRLRPAELVVVAAIIGVFVGAIVVMGTREWLTALEWAGIAFVVALVVTAMLLLAVVPKDERPDAEHGDDEHRDDERPSGH